MTAPSVRALFRLACLAWLISFSSFVTAQSAARNESASVTPMIRAMVGTWKVQSKMWPGREQKAVDLPPATVRREVVSNAFLQEVMQPIDASGGAFTRIAYFSFNPVNQQYEYFSLDSRLPQMMSYTLPGANKSRDGKVELAGASFVAPEWGGRKGVPFMYRLDVGPVESNRQTVQLFLTEQAQQAKEFLAFEYVYTREP